jgi:hypothetical protein
VGSGLAGGLLALLLALGRSFPWRLALLAGFAGGVLVYATWQSVARLAPLYRRRRPPGSD